MESASKRLYEVLELSKWSRHSVTVIRDRTLSPAHRHFSLWTFHAFDSPAPYPRLEENQKYNNSNNKGISLSLSNTLQLSRIVAAQKAESAVNTPTRACA